MHEETSCSLPAISIRWTVAQNPNTSPEILVNLADDEYDRIRISVTHTHNPNTPPEILEKLTEDERRKANLEAHISEGAPTSVNQRSSRRSPQTDWSIPIYSIQNYSEIESEIDEVVDKAVDEYARKYKAELLT